MSEIGARLPSDFPRREHIAAYRAVLKSTRGQGTPDDWRSEFIGSWMAIAYRFRTTARVSKAFSVSVSRFGDTPKPPQRFQQDEALFMFFVAGLAVLESAFYAVHFIAALIDALAFPTDLNAREKINPATTASRFASGFPRESLTLAMSQLVKSTEYREWRQMRNVLAHRITPGRLISVGGAQSLTTLKLPVPLEVTPELTSRRLGWLADQIRDLDVEARAFAVANL